MEFGGAGRSSLGWGWAGVGVVWLGWGGVGWVVGWGRVARVW